MSVIYLDNNATTRLDPMVLDAMMPFLTDPEDLVSVIDKLIADGTGRITVDLSNMDEGITFTTVNSTDCGKLGACAQPNEPSPEEEDDELL
jgi:hypothetical protein